MEKTTKSGDKAKKDHVAPVSPEPHGQSLLHLVEARKKDLEALLAKSPNDPSRDPSHAGAVEAAINAIKTLLTGDLKDINPHTAAELNVWMESTKHLCETPPKSSHKH